MKDILHKLMSLTLALLVLGSTMSFSIAKHYCGEHLVDVAFFGDAEPCEMEKALTAKYGEEHNKTIDCCSDEHIILQGQDELKLQFETIVTSIPLFLPPFDDSITSLDKIGEEQQVLFEGYPPPLITSDFQLLYEQYLI